MTSCPRYGMPSWWLALALPVLALALPGVSASADGVPAITATSTLASLRQQQRWMELRLEARAILAQAPTDADAHAALVEALWHGGALTAALASADRARAAGADSAALRLAQSNALALRGRWDEVARLMAADADAPGAAAETVWLAGMALHEEGRLDDARRYFNRFTQQEPAAARGWLQLARLELAARQPAAAQAALNKLPAGARNSDAALYLTARLQADAGQAQAAVATLTHALEKAPLRARLYALRARQLANLQAWPEAARDIHSALLLGTSAAEDYLLACEAARMLDDTEALAAYARAGMDAHPQRSEFPLQLARALRGLGNAGQARTLLDKSVQDFPGNTALVLELALAQAAEDKQQDVVSTLDALLAKQPSAQGYALRAYARLRLGDLVRANEDAGNALVLEPGLANALLVQARVALARGEPVLAEAPCRQVLARAPGLVWAHTTCGEVALALGRAESALVQAEQALRLSPQDADALRLQESIKHKGARP